MGFKSSFGILCPSRHNIATKRLLTENSSARKKEDRTFPEVCDDLFGPIWGFLRFADMPIL